MPEDLSTIPVKDYVYLRIVLHVKCQNCGRDRIIHSLLPNIFKPEDRLHQVQIDTLAQRMVCGNCGTRGPKAELIREPD